MRSEILARNPMMNSLSIACGRNAGQFPEPIPFGFLVVSSEMDQEWNGGQSTFWAVQLYCHSKGNHTAYTWCRAKTW